MPKSDLHEYVEVTTEHAEVRAGYPLPLGTQERSGGVNFSLFSRNASGVQLELYEHATDAKPSRVIDLNAARHRTGDVWHVWIAGLVSGQLYAYRIDGPYDPCQGFRFDHNRLLLDPFATAVSSKPPWEFEAARG